MEQLTLEVARAAAAKDSDNLVRKVENSFHVVDYIVFVVFLIVSAGIGIFFSLTGGRQKTTKEFLMGNRNMQLLPVSISILVSFTSAILILGSPAEIYLNGIIYMYYAIGMSLACVIAALIFVPLFFPLRLTSVFEYLEQRFNSRAVRIVGNLLYIMKGIVYMGIAMFAPSTAMEQVTNGAFKKEYAIIMSGAIGTFYTMLGGLKAVVWTDVFQAGVMLAGVIGIFIKATIDAGGFGAMFEYADKYNRIVLWEDSLDPTERHTIWGLVIGSAIGWAGTFGVNQASVQRFCSLPTMAKARWAVLLNIPGSLILTWASCLAGLAIFAYYASIGCDIFGAGWAGKNEIVPYYVMDRMNVPAFPGLLVAALFSGALSSVSSSLNACSAIVWKDILQPMKFFSKMQDNKAAWLTKALVVVFGLLGTGMGFMAISLGGTVLQASLSFSGAIGGPSLGLFVLGAFFPFTGWLGAVIGPLVGVALSLWVSIGAYSVSKQEIHLQADTSRCYANLTTPAPGVESVSSGLDSFYSISYMWYSAIGTFATIIVGLLVTAITRLMGIKESADHRYIYPLVHRLCCCCPVNCRTAANCGVGDAEIATIGDDEDVAVEEAEGKKFELELNEVKTDELKAPLSDSSEAASEQLQQQAASSSSSSSSPASATASATALKQQEEQENAGFVAEDAEGGESDGRRVAASPEATTVVGDVNASFSADPTDPANSSARRSSAEASSMPPIETCRA